MGPTLCATESNEIETEPLVGTVKTSTSPQDRVTFAPKTGKLIAVVVFKGPECPLAGEQPISGSFTQKLPTGQTEAVTQPFEGLGSAENNSLQLGANKIYLEKGKALVKLASGLKWSFH